MIRKTQCKHQIHIKAFADIGSKTIQIKSNLGNHLHGDADLVSIVEVAISIQLVRRAVFPQKQSILRRFQRRSGKDIALKYATKTEAWQRTYLATNEQEKFSAAMEKTDVPSNTATIILKLGYMQMDNAPNNDTMMKHVSISKLLPNSSELY